MNAMKHSKHSAIIDWLEIFGKEKDALKVSKYLTIMRPLDFSKGSINVLNNAESQEKYNECLNRVVRIKKAWDLRNKE
jgi:hypothetical protein